MGKGEVPSNVLADWFNDFGATQPVRKVGPGYESQVRALGGNVVRQTAPPPQSERLPEIAVETAILPRWRVGGRVDHDGQVCPLCFAGYAFGRAESTQLPELAILCFSCQREIEALCFSIAAAMSKACGRAVTSLEVMARFFSEVAPLGPLARTYGHPY